MCEECLTDAMRAETEPELIASRYRLSHALRHSVAPAAADPAGAVALSEEEQQLLAFERQWWRQPGAKVQAVADELGLGLVAYYARLNELIALPAALAFDAPLVNRLRRVRDQAVRLRLATR